MATVSLNWTANTNGAVYSQYYQDGRKGLGTFAITSVTGTYAEGGTLTINGDRFGAEGPLVVAADNYYGKVNGASAGTPQIGSYASLSGGTIDTGTGLGGNPSLLYQDGDIGRTDGAPDLGMPGAHDSIRVAAGISLAKWQGWFPFREYKIFQATYTNSDQYNAKDNWIMLGDRGDGYHLDGNGNDHIVPNNAATLQNNIHSNNGHFGATYYAPEPFLRPNAWCFNTYTLLMPTGDPSSPVDYSISTRNGTEINDFSFTRSLDWDGADARDVALVPNPSWYDRIKGYSQASTGQQRWRGAGYFAVTDQVSGTRRYAACCVEIMNAATEAAATIKGVLPSTSWGNNSITVLSWTLGIAAADAYIRVKDKDDNATPWVKYTEVSA